MEAVQQEPARVALVSSVPQTGPRVRVVGLSRRLVAAVIDLVCLSPVLFLSGWIALRLAGISISSAKTFRPEVLLELFLWGGVPFYSVVAVAFALVLLYAFLFVSLLGHTPGLRLVRARVIDVYGDRPRWWRVLLRCAGIVVSLGLLALGLLWIGVDREKRGLHDWLSGTYVIRAVPAERPGVAESASDGVEAGEGG